jgi:hypothetical protein
MRRDRGSGAVIAAVIGAIITGIATIVAAVIAVSNGSGGSTGDGTTGGGTTGGGSASAKIFLSRDSAPAGETLTVSGEGFGAGETVEIRVHISVVASPQADEAGRFVSVTITVPELPVGWDATVSAIGQDTLRAATRQLRVGG